MGSIILKCKKIGLEKKLVPSTELCKEDLEAHPQIPPKGSIINYEDENEPQFNGMYKVKNVSAKIDLYGQSKYYKWGKDLCKLMNIDYIVELKKIK